MYNFINRSALLPIYRAQSATSNHTELSKIFYKYYNIITMNNMITNNNLLSGDITARVKPLRINLTK